RTYQELIFDGLGLGFCGERYYLPLPQPTGLQGDVAISSTAGPIWPMKKWAYYNELKKELEAQDLKVNILESRPTLLEHLADVQGHRCLVSGDSLPMHLALGSDARCVSIFTCTSPWEIYGYGLQEKIVSPLLEKFFYKRGYDRNATTAISVEKEKDAGIPHLYALTVRAGEVSRWLPCLSREQQMRTGNFQKGSSAGGSFHFGKERTSKHGCLRQGWRFLRKGLRRFQYSACCRDAPYPRNSTLLSDRCGVNYANPIGFAKPPDRSHSTNLLR